MGLVGCSDGGASEEGGAPQPTKVTTLFTNIDVQSIQRTARTRGQAITQEPMEAFIRDLELPDADKIRLLSLTPWAYIGLAAELVRHIES